MADEETTPPENASPSEDGDVSDATEEAAAPDASVPDEDASSEAAASEEPEAAEEVPEEPRAPDHPKALKRRAKAAKAATRPTRAPTTPEERQAERLQKRRRSAELRRKGRVRAREKARASHGDARETPPREHVPGKQKTRRGVVVSNRAAKTITVRIDTTSRHRRYEKIVRTSRTVHAHDEREEAGIGDKVVLRESRPLSRTKRWRLIEVLERAK